MDLSQADYAFNGENHSDYAGRSVSSAGDVDGDNLDDFLIGAYGNDDGGNGDGKVYLILGSSLGNSSVIDLSQVSYSFIEENSASAGYSVSSAGDIDGDGFPEIMFSASSWVYIRSIQ